MEKLRTKFLSFVGMVWEAVSSIIFIVFSHNNHNCKVSEVCFHIVRVLLLHQESKLHVFVFKSR